MISPSDKKVTEAVCKNLNVPVEFIDFDNPSCDPAVDLGGLFQVCIVDQEPQVLIGHNPAKLYLVTATSVIPGCRYHRDGSGTPDDVDVAELATFRNYADAFADALSRYATFMALSAFEDEAMYQDHLEMRRLEEEVRF
jgi:hypothetical protein